MRCGGCGASPEVAGSPRSKRCYLIALTEAQGVGVELSEVGLDFRHRTAMDFRKLLPNLQMQPTRRVTLVGARLIWRR